MRTKDLMEGIINDPAIRESLEEYQDNVFLEDFLFVKYCEALYPEDYFAIKALTLKPLSHKKGICLSQHIEIMLVSKIID